MYYSNEKIKRGESQKSRVPTLETFEAQAFDPGVAKFGIALEWGSRGPEFESQHSDQKLQETVNDCFLQLFCVLIFQLPGKNLGLLLTRLSIGTAASHCIAEVYPIEINKAEHSVPCTALFSFVNLLLSRRSLHQCLS